MPLAPYAPQTAPAALTYAAPLRARCSPAQADQRAAYAAAYALQRRTGLEMLTFAELTLALGWERRRVLVTLSELVDAGLLQRWGSTRFAVADPGRTAALRYAGAVAQPEQ